LLPGLKANQSYTLEGFCRIRNKEQPFSFPIKIGVPTVNDVSIKGSQYYSVEREEVNDFSATFETQILMTSGDTDYTKYITE